MHLLYLVAYLIVYKIYERILSKNTMRETLVTLISI